MLRSREVMAFVATTNPARAKRFYADTLGLRFVSEDPFAVVFDAGGTVLRVAVVEALHPAAYTVLGWIVPGVSGAARDLERKGVAFRRYDGMPQDDQGIWTSPGGARIAWFQDPDGNTLSLTEFDGGRRKAAARARPKSSKPRKPSTSRTKKR